MLDFDVVGSWEEEEVPEWEFRRVEEDALTEEDVALIAAAEFARDGRAEQVRRTLAPVADLKFGVGKERKMSKSKKVKVTEIDPGVAVLAEELGATPAEIEAVVDLVVEDEPAVEMEADVEAEEVAVVDDSVQVECIKDGFGKLKVSVPELKVQQEFGVVAVTKNAKGRNRFVIGVAGTAFEVGGLLDLVDSETGRKLGVEKVEQVIEFSPETDGPTDLRGVPWRIVSVAA